MAFFEARTTSIGPRRQTAAATRGPTSERSCGGLSTGIPMAYHPLKRSILRNRGTEPDYKRHGNQVRPAQYWYFRLNGTDQQETTVSGVLARELDGIASAHMEEL